MAGNTFRKITAKYQDHHSGGLCVRVSGKNYWFPTVSIRTPDLENVQRGELITFKAQVWIIEQHDLWYLTQDQRK